VTLPRDIEDRLFAESVMSWCRTFGGVSAISLASKLQVPHEDAMQVMESWVEAGRGRINANVELSLVSLPEPGSCGVVSFSPVTTHIFFPSRKELTEHFYSSGAVRSEPPEFKKRLLCGEQQLALCFFSEEALARYFARLDWYEVDDSTAGGHIRSKSAAPGDRCVDVRFGKGKAQDGKIFVTAIYKDLYRLSAPEQRHWHAHEIVRPSLDPSDGNFRLFAARTYDGAFVEFPKPVKAVEDSIIELNDKFSPNPLFGRFENEHLRTPVENTNKALADSCSELYKVIGTDSLKAKPLKAFLKNTLGKNEADFTHDSGRPLSALQLLECVESELGVTTRLSVAIKEIAKYRVEADHKVLITSSDKPSYGEEFVLLCNQFAAAANVLAQAVEPRNVT
jgi:hypothetical protein